MALGEGLAEGGGGAPSFAGHAARLVRDELAQATEELAQLALGRAELIPQLCYGLLGRGGARSSREAQDRASPLEVLGGGDLEVGLRALDHRHGVAAALEGRGLVGDLGAVGGGVGQGRQERRSPGDLRRLGPPDRVARDRLDHAARVVDALDRVAGRRREEGGPYVAGSLEG